MIYTKKKNLHKYKKKKNLCNSCRLLWEEEGGTTCINSHMYDKYENTMSNSTIQHNKGIIIHASIKPWRH